MTVLFGRYVFSISSCPCAQFALQTLEETGFDVTHLLDRQIFVKNTLKEQQLTLYIVPDVPEDTVFQTRTRKEISVSITCASSSKI